MNGEYDIITGDGTPDDNDGLPCPFCGSDENVYWGEEYDDEIHLGSLFRCNDCGSVWRFGLWDALHYGDDLME